MPNPKRKVNNPLKRLRSKADKLWFERYLKPTCEVCGEPASQLHHNFPKSLYGHLRYDKDNGISLCRKCHFQLHNSDPTIQMIIHKNRGEKWYQELLLKAQNPPKNYKINIKYYKTAMKNLEKETLEEEAERIKAETAYEEECSIK